MDGRFVIEPPRRHARRPDAARQERRNRRLRITLLALATTTLRPPLPAVPPPPAHLQLSPGAVVERAIAGEEQHRFELALGPGSYWGIVEQVGVDLTVGLLDEEGRTLLEVDNPLGRYGRESLLFELPAPAIRRLLVFPASSRVAAGRYRIEVRELALDTAADRARLAALRATTSGGTANRKTTTAGRREALGHYERALVHWQQLGDAAGEAQVQHAAALLHRRLGESRPALERYEAARLLWRSLGDRHLEAAALNDLGLTHFDLGQNHTAMPLLEQAILIQRQLGNRFGEAVTRNNVCLRRLSEGELAGAVSCFEQVLGLHREAGEELEEARTLINLGGAYYSLGEPEPAFENFRASLSLMRSIGDRLGEAQALNNLAACHQGLGELQEALLYYGEARDVFRQLEDRRWLGRTLNNLGVTYLRLGNPQRAELFLEQALDLRRQAADRRGEAVTLNNLGKARFYRGQPRAALDLHVQALRLSRESHDRRREATTLTLLGRSRAALGELEAALDDLEQARRRLHSIGDRRGEAEALLESGRVLIALDRPQSGAESLGAALELYAVMKHRLGEALVLVELGRAERRLGHLESALTRARAALERVESLRSNIGSLSLRARFLGSKREAYELEVDLLMSLHSREPEQGHDRRALLASEQARARSMLDMLEQAGADLYRDADPALLARRGALQRRLNAKARRQLELLSRMPDGEEAAGLEHEIDAVIAELEGVEAQIRRQSPSVGDPAAPRHLDADGIRQLLDPDTTLLAYLLGEERSFLWRVGAERLESFVLPARDEIESLARGLHEQLSTLDVDGGPSRRRLLAAAAELLLGPVAGRLRGSRLVVVADGALHYLPFAALPLPPSGDPLLRHYEVVNLPSATVLARQRRALSGRRPARGRVAVLADPVFSRQDPRLTVGAGAVAAARSDPEGGAPVHGGRDRERKRGPVSGRPASFDRLPATRREAERIASLASGREVLMALDFEASRLTLLGRLSDYRYVHVATHGLLDASHPELSGVVLSLVDEEGRSRDGFVRVHDLYDLELRAELVVLSGCQTALGSELRGEGLIGLTHGFMDAGAARVLSSLWRVSDRSTAELMASFYRAMWVEGLRPAAALRSAQLEILAERRAWRHPYYWAGFVLQGDWQ